MRRLILGLLAWWVCGATPAFVQQKVASNAGGNASAAFTGAPVAGNSILVLVSYLSTDTIASVTVEGVNITASATAPSTVTGVTTTFYYVHNIVGTSTQCQVSGTNGTRVSANCSEWSGLTNAAPEATNTNTGLANATVTTNSVTPASANNLVIAMGGWTANDYSSGPTNSFTRMTQTGGGALFQEGAYLIQSSATAQSTGWTLTAGINWAAAIAVFGAPASGPTNAQRSAGFWTFP